LFFSFLQFGFHLFSVCFSFSPVSVSSANCFPFLSFVFQFLFPFFHFFFSFVSFYFSFFFSLFFSFFILFFNFFSLVLSFFSYFSVSWQWSRILSLWFFCSWSTRIRQDSSRWPCPDAVNYVPLQSLTAWPNLFRRPRMFGSRNASRGYQKALPVHERTCLSKCHPWFLH
jgi:hypothetical protein